MFKLWGCTLPETNSSPLKIDGWKTTFLLKKPMFRGYVSFREGTHQKKQDPDFNNDFEPPALLPAMKTNKFYEDGKVFSNRFGHNQ